MKKAKDVNLINPTTNERNHKAKNKNKTTKDGKPQSFPTFSLSLRPPCVYVYLRSSAQLSSKERQKRENRKNLYRLSSPSLLSPLRLTQLPSPRTIFVYPQIVILFINSPHKKIVICCFPLPRPSLPKRDPQLSSFHRSREFLLSISVIFGFLVFVFSSPPVAVRGFGLN